MKDHIAVLIEHVDATTVRLRNETAPDGPLVTLQSIDPESASAMAKALADQIDARIVEALCRQWRS